MIRTNEQVGVLLTALLLLIGPTRPATAAAEDDRMDQVDQEFGQPNPNAPAALSRFAFLISRWRCEARVRSANREWQTFQATWLGRYILDGYAMAHFTWRGEKSDDRKIWSEFMVVEAYRSKE